MTLSQSDITAIATLVAEKVAGMAALPRWIRLREAVAYSAIGKMRLKKLAEAGAIVGFPDPDSGRGDWIFDRYSIDAYREGQAGGIQSEALAIMDSL